MDRIDELSQNLDDISGLVDQILGVIAAGDALAVDLRAQIATLLAGDTAMAAKVDAAFAKSVAAEDKLRAAVPQVPPVGGTPLLTSYSDSALFGAAVQSYTGPEKVTLDGAQVKAGTDPAMDFFTQTDGSVSTIPTDGGAP